MKKLNLVSCVLLLIIGCNSNSKELNENSTQRDSFYNTIELGDYGIGFSDTVIYNSNIRFDFLPDKEISYTQYDYSGPTPLFLQIWHPIEKNGVDKPITRSAYRARSLFKRAEKRVRTALCKNGLLFRAVQYHRRLCEL